MNQETVADDLQETAEMSLDNAIIEGAEQPGPVTAQSDDPALVEEAAAPVVVSTPEKAPPEATPAAEEPQTLVNPPKVPRPVAPYRFQLPCSITYLCLQSCRASAPLYRKA